MGTAVQQVSGGGASVSRASVARGRAESNAPRPRLSGAASALDARQESEAASNVAGSRFSERLSTAKAKSQEAEPPSRTERTSDASTPRENRAARSKASDAQSTKKADDAAVNESGIEVESADPTAADGRQAEDAGGETRVEALRPGERTAGKAKAKDAQEEAAQLSAEEDANLQLAQETAALSPPVAVAIEATADSETSVAEKKEERTTEEHRDSSYGAVATVDPVLLAVAVASSGTVVSSSEGVLTSEGSAQGTAQDVAGSGATGPVVVTGESTPSQRVPGVVEAKDGAKANAATATPDTAAQANGPTAQQNGATAFGAALEAAEQSSSPEAGGGAKRDSADRSATGGTRATAGAAQEDSALKSLANFGLPGVGDGSGVGAALGQVGGGSGQAGSVSEARFAEANKDSIVRAVRVQLEPVHPASGASAAATGNGKITLRLDPPEVGALQVAVEMKNGLASVSLVTENAEAARLMTHTLGQLRESLEAAGVSVDRMTVSQAAPSATSNNTSNQDNGRNQNGSGSQQGGQNAFSWADGESARREQQRRQMLERLWRKVTGDDVNYVA